MPSQPVFNMASRGVTPLLSNSLYVLIAISVDILAPNNFDARNHLNICFESAEDKSIPSSVENFPPTESMSFFVILGIAVKIKNYPFKSFYIIYITKKAWLPEL